MADKVLVVDDEERIRTSLQGVLADEGFEVLHAADGKEALEVAVRDLPEVVLLDIAMPGRDGIETLGDLKKQVPDIEVIIMSGHGTIETAVKATKLGAYDFIEKPISYDKLLLVVRHALAVHRLEEENLLLRQRIARRSEIIGQSEAIIRLRREIGIAAPTNGWVLITGENGTGKELVARAIHEQSKRKDSAFVDVNCAAIPDELIESELFGHERGSFTGAIQKKRGKFDLAHGGTLFLDEIADMSLRTQAKILRILQEQKFDRVGGTESISVDVRVIAATNRDLEKEIEKGSFREDLYFRLNIIPLYVPALRERSEDIPFLVDHFLSEYCAETGKELMSICPAARKLLANYHWPGNVRELKNMVERVVLMTPSQEINVGDIPEGIRSPVSRIVKRSLPAASLDEARNRFEKEYIEQKLLENGGNISKTAQQIGLARESLSRKIKSYRIDVRRGDRAGVI